MNLLNQTLMYVQQAPSDAAQASLVSPDIVASRIIQFIDGGIANKVRKIINRVKIALNVLLFTLLFITSTGFTPEYSRRIIWNPITPIIKGKNKLIIFGKKETKFNLKKLLNITSKMLKKMSIDPIYK